MENIESLFVKSVRNKYRYSSSRGELSTEDLWDLSLESLDEIAIKVSDQLEKIGKRSFIKKKTQQSDELQTQLEVVKYVIETKITEQAEKQARTKKRGQLEFLKKLKEQKEIERLEGMSSEDLDKQIEELESQI